MPAPGRGLARLRQLRHQLRHHRHHVGQPPRHLPPDQHRQPRLGGGQPVLVAVRGFPTLPDQGGRRARCRRGDPPLPLGLLYILPRREETALPSDASTRGVLAHDARSVGPQRCSPPLVPRPTMLRLCLQGREPVVERLPDGLAQQLGEQAGQRTRPGFLGEDVRAAVVRLQAPDV